MKKIGNAALALLAGIIVGSIVNITIVNVGPMLIPLPEGADVSTMEGLKNSMLLFNPVNFIPPFLGHALGTLVAAFLTAKLAKSYVLGLALATGFVFLIGGVSAVVMLGGPIWFMVLDLTVAYIPMAYLGYSLAGGSRESDG